MEAARSRAHAKQTSHRHSNGRQARHINSGRLLRRHLAGFYTAVDITKNHPGVVDMDQTIVASRPVTRDTAAYEICLNTAIIFAPFFGHFQARKANRRRRFWPPYC